MKFRYRLSGFVFLAGLMCFLPSAFGQSPANAKATSVARSVLNNQPSSLLAFAFTSGHDLYNNNGKGGNGGYGNGGYGNGGNGKGGDGNGGTCSYSPSKGGDKCAAVPEGGTPLMYLLLAGLSCLGAMVLRRQTSMPRSH
ncbi:MAG: hypothetical protein WBV63_19125 [Candidatus Sulfotelmatobacter sp.]